MLAQRSVYISNRQPQNSMHLQTPRLLLRDFVLDDFTAVHAYASLQETVRFMEWGPNSEEQTKDFLHRKLAAQQANPRVEYEFAIVLQQTGQVIGGVGLRLNRPDHRAADMGYVLHPDHWNRGYASEAARAILDFGFNRHNLHRIMATCDPANRASARVLEKIGMQYEGRIRHHMLHKETWRDSLVYAILETDLAEQTKTKDER
jgi:ribosomal-protein-alanine N-acetyltransferase